ncbi:MAG: SMP-30/gluconolactonase/LRE family protein [Pseudomonadota bacterium]
MTAQVYDDRCCTLGEGPLWHPARQELFWFDILEKRLHSAAQTWTFDRYVSAAGWIDETQLLIASSTDLFVFDLTTGAQTHLVELEADKPNTRSNDGRADPWGGFWIGTMGLNAEPEAGAIYRFFGGKITKLYDKVSIPNAISFAPDGSCAYFADTATQRVMRQPLDAQGWPQGKPQLHVDLTQEDLNPDGAVTDADGVLWIACWGASKVIGYDPSGACVGELRFPASQMTCPALAPGTLYATSAAEGIEEPQGGKTFALNTDIPFKPEAQIAL